jgi:hypothetical protein
MHSDADRVNATRPDGATRDRGERTALLDLQHRDLVATGIDGDQEAAMIGDLNRALGRYPVS